MGIVGGPVCVDRRTVVVAPRMVTAVAIAAAAVVITVLIAAVVARSHRRGLPVVDRRIPTMEFSRHILIAHSHPEARLYDTRRYVKPAHSGRFKAFQHLPHANIRRVVVKTPPGPQDPPRLPPTKRFRLPEPFNLCSVIANGPYGAIEHLRRNRVERRAPVMLPAPTVTTVVVLDHEWQPSNSSLRPDELGKRPQERLAAGRAPDHPVVVRSGLDSSECKRLRTLDQQESSLAADAIDDPATSGPKWYEVITAA